MATNDLLKRLIDAGLSFTQMTQAKAEEIVREMQRSGQLRMDEAQTTVQELIDRGKESTENLVGLVQREVGKQLSVFGIDLGDLEKRIEELTARIRHVGPPKKAAAKQPAPPKPAATEAAPAAKKAAPAKKTTAKKTTAKKTTAKKTTAQKTTAKKTTKKTAPAKKAAAKKSGSR